MNDIEILDTNTIAKKLKDRNLTEVSKVIGVSTQTLSKLSKGEGDKKYKKTVLIAVSKYFSEF